MAAWPDEGTGLELPQRLRGVRRQQAALAASSNGIKSERTKHVDVKYHFITETVEGGDVKLKWVPTQQQEADIFTKPLHAPVFLQLRSRIMSQ